MVTIQLPKDFKEFFLLLNSHKAQYLLIGGYAVGYYGFPRATGDIDIWINANSQNAEKLASVLSEFGFPSAQATMFLEKNKIIRIGNPPLRLELLTSISGVEFAACYSRKKTVSIDGVEINVIGLEDLKINKEKSGRHKDLNDLENLPRE